MWNMNKLKKYVLSMLMLTSGLVCLAQSGITVRGKVEDAEGAPVLGAAVMVRGTDSGALVDADGAYRLDNVPADAVLVASSLGFADAEIKEIGGRYEPSRTPIDSPYVLACAQAVKDGFGEEPILFPGVGGAGPNCVFTDILGMPAIEIPFADALQNNHAPNESQVLSGFMNGIKTSAAVIERIPTVSRERGGEKK